MRPKLLVFSYLYTRQTKLTQPDQPEITVVMIIPGQVLEKAEKLNAENVTFIQHKDGYDVFRLSFKQSNLRHNGTEIPMETGMPVIILFKDGVAQTAKYSDHDYWLAQ